MRTNIQRRNCSKHGKVPLKGTKCMATTTEENQDSKEKLSKNIREDY